MAGYKIKKFPKSRIATIDVCEIGRRKHHIAAMIEIDITASREKIKTYKKEIKKITFTAWLIKAISLTLKDYESAAAFLKGKRRMIIFNDINVSMVVEKNIQGHKVPMPMIIEKANERAIESITEQISQAQNQVLTDKDIILQTKATYLERVYFMLPGFLRRTFWRYLIKHPNYAYSKMGNVAITSISAARNVSGWFIPVSIHPICFGISSVMKKPVVIENKIEIREMLNMTILLDHDVFDGAPMARFISDLTKNLKDGMGL
ncbi:MAG: 2-oxo acid dehydrogenase subunit E2 [Bacteroidales bacterium]|nr:2-oxo acid dehydrogenase subunit E2 [Bacteroidales bacterium]MCF8392141.1 2-oxo acid dehydrogenase subunit E2 [Bacteroidales bacterium]